MSVSERTQAIATLNQTLKEFSFKHINTELIEKQILKLISGY
jgi:hypothetical protein